VIHLRFAVLEWTEHGAVTHFKDGTSYGALPHPEEPHYQYLAYRMGLDGDTLRYCREHELAHLLVGEEFDQPSTVLWALAHNLVPDRFEAAAEEALALCLQRYARTNEPPLVDGCDWKRLRARFLSLVED
jgi:hypothetical protein